jgi:hypothetical protein
MPVVVIFFSEKGPPLSRGSTRRQILSQENGGQIAWECRVPNIPITTAGNTPCKDTRGATLSANALSPCKGQCGKFRIKYHRYSDFLRLIPRSLKNKRTFCPVYQSLLAYGHFTAGLPKQNFPIHTQWPLTADFPNHSYGIAEDFRPKTGHPTSFEVY